MVKKKKKKTFLFVYTRGFPTDARGRIPPHEKFDRLIDAYTENEADEIFFKYQDRMQEDGEIWEILSLNEVELA